MSHGLREQIPPAVDGARAQARAFARVGTREESAIGRRIPGADGADSLVAAGPPPLVALVRSTGVVPAWTTAVVDADERVVGTLVAPGGTSHDPVWIPNDVDLRWTTAVARMRRWSDSVGVARGETRLVRGRVRALPVRGRVLLAQTAYAWRADAAPTISSIALFDPRVGAVTPISSALSVEAAGPAVVPPRVEDADARLFQRARAALSRGDWAGFGAAFDSLGATLGRRKGPR